jgi:hypothetical protein
MKNRNSGMMAGAKADFTKAVNLLDTSFDTFYARFDAAAQTKYQWLSGNGGFVKQLKAAMDSGGNFYIPKIAQYKSLFNAMDGRPAWITATEGRHGLNLGKLFTPAYLTADKLITTESGGKAPRFFGFTGGGTGNEILDETEIAQYDTYGVELSGNFKDVFVKVKGKTADQYRWVFDLFPDLLFPQADADAMDQIYAKENVTAMYGYYQKR